MMIIIAVFQALCFMIAWFFRTVITVLIIMSAIEFVVAIYEAVKK